MSPTTAKPTAENGSVTGLVTGIIGDAQTLFKQQVELVRHEIRNDFRKTRDAGLKFVAGVALATVGAILLTTMLVYLLCAIWPQLPLWGSYAIVGVCFTLVGATLLWWGKSEFESFNPLPDQSAQALQENLKWITNPSSPTNPK
jgi:uncharacterized membrane protein YqjE